jgi:hypothetical protein
MAGERPEPGGEAFPAIRTGLSIGNKLARFEILNRVGVGGMGIVYVAHDPMLDRQVALKVLRTGAHGPLRAAELKARLLLEAQAMARLSHPNVITVHEVGVVDEQIFIVMELNDGGTLRSWLAQEPRPLRERVRVFIEAGRGLAAAHAVRLVHRDFKPDNVLLARDGRARVVDFGLVRAPSAGDQPSRRPSRDVYAPMSLTISGAVLGTPAYMAPEQHRAEVADHRSDQFSFCVSLYEALYGLRPFAGDTYRELVVNILEGQVRPPPEGTEVPVALQRILERGLASAPADRYPNMTALLDDLAATQVEEAAVAAVPRVGEPAAAPGRRGLALALASGLLVAAGAVALALGLAQRDGAVSPADAAPAVKAATPDIPIVPVDAGGAEADAAPPARTGGDEVGARSRRRRDAARSGKQGPAEKNPAADAAPATDSAAERRRRTLELMD